MHAYAGADWGNKSYREYVVSVALPSPVIPFPPIPSLPLFSLPIPFLPFPSLFLLSLPILSLPFPFPHLPFPSPAVKWHPNPVMVSGSAVSFPSGVRGGAPAVCASLAWDILHRLGLWRASDGRKV